MAGYPLIITLLYHFFGHHDGFLQRIGAQIALLMPGLLLLLLLMAVELARSRRFIIHFEHFCRRCRQMLSFLTLSRRIQYSGGLIRKSIRVDSGWSDLHLNFA